MKWVSIFKLKGDNKMDKKQDKIINTIEIDMDRTDFIKSIGLDKHKGKIVFIDASTSSYDENIVSIKVKFELEDKLKQIDYTKTIKSTKGDK